ncbi:hypothetical protein ACJIZ3_015548 [Penstemon smallii]|uniref:BHLH domain-containing protein n=1 Tax=Penstemon smallii TaxID=265156 RepID=A0ABD3RMT5_9LAMI
MAGNGGFEEDPLQPGCYSHLLFAEEIPGLEKDGFFSTFTSSSFSSSDDSNNNCPKMLCFGDYANATNTGQKSGLTCTGSASTENTTLPKSNRKRDGSGSVWVQNPGVHAGAPTGSQRNSKKLKSDNSTVTGGYAKVNKKEKLGERITALQQLVSPFGKTDTASVLHEALGYIRFLQDQVQVLCSPYLQRLSPSSAPLQSAGKELIERRKDDLRSRGLCLVPVELTLHVADSNGADLWSSAAMVNNVSST